MVLGTPVVASDCPFGPGEIITHSANGLLFPPGDPVALARAVENLLPDSTAIERIAEATRQRSQVFSASAAAGKVEKLLLNQLECRNA